MCAGNNDHCSFADEEFGVLHMPTIQKTEEGNTRRAKFADQKRAQKETKIASGALAPIRRGQFAASTSLLASDVAGPTTALLARANQVLSHSARTTDDVEIVRDEVLNGLGYEHGVRELSRKRGRQLRDMAERLSKDMARLQGVLTSEDEPDEDIGSRSEEDDEDEERTEGEEAVEVKKPKARGVKRVKKA